MTADRDDAGARLRRVVSRGRFLGLIGLGAVGALTARWVIEQLEGFRFNTVERPRPRFDPATYRLRIGGLVERPAVLTYDDLTSLPSVRQTSDFHCVEGWGVDDVRWDGISMQAVIEMVRPLPDARFVSFYSMGGVYSDSLTLEQASQSDVLLAYGMYEKPLSPEHGSPLRLVVPKMFGYKGPKWLDRVEFGADRIVGYWEQRGWKIDAWVT